MSSKVIEVAKGSSAVCGGDNYLYEALESGTYGKL